MLREVKNWRWIEGQALFGKPWIDFVVGKKAFNLYEFSTRRRMPKATWEGWAATQKTIPVRFMTTPEPRYYWWFEDKVYWESEDLTPHDLLALVRERQRRKQNQLEWARASLAAGGTPPGRRGPLPLELRRAVFARDGGKCRVCGSTFDIQYDHIIPVSRGGPTTLENLQLLCGDCNRHKANLV